MAACRHRHVVFNADADPLPVVGDGGLPLRGGAGVPAPPSVVTDILGDSGSLRAFREGL